MKNKKTLWVMLITFCLIMPAMLFMTACGHKHDFSKEWTKDAENHWHVCLDENCDEIDSKGAHEYTDDNDFSCNTCGYERTAQENALNLTIQPKTYNCAQQGLVQGTDFTVTNGTAVVTYKNKGSAEAFTKTEPKDAGEYTARIYVAGNAIYKGIDRRVDFKIEKYKILTKETSFIKYYDGTTTGEDAAISPYNGDYETYKKFAPDKLRVKMTFPDAKAGTRSTKVELFTNCTDKTVLNNYDFDKSLAYSVISQKSIYLGNGRKDEKLKVYNTLVDGEFSLVSLQDNDFGVIDGDDVALQIQGTTSGLTFGDKIIIVAKDSEYVAGENYLAKLVGEDASNYSLWDYANVTYTERKTEFVGQVRNNSSRSFGTAEDAIKYGSTHFVVNQKDNDYRSLIYTAENSEKQVTISIYAGSKKIAQIKRACFKSAIDSAYTYFGGSLDRDNGTADFNLIKNVEGYTDSEGRWICLTPSVTLEMVLEFEDTDVFDTDQEHQTIGAGKLTTGSIYIFKVNTNSPDKAVKIIYGSLRVNIRVFNAEDQGNGNDSYEGQELEYDAKNGDSYMGPVYFYVEVLEGSSTATLTLEIISLM